jgi:hypothetical protein
MEHITLDKVALMVGQLQLSILNLQSYVEKLEQQIAELENSAKEENN